MNNSKSSKQEPFTNRVESRQINRDSFLSDPLISGGLHTVVEKCGLEYEWWFPTQSIAPQPHSIIRSEDTLLTEATLSLLNHSNSSIKDGIGSGATSDEVMPVLDAVAATVGPFAPVSSTSELIAFQNTNRTSSNTVTSIAPAGTEFDFNYGYGLVDASAAVATAVGRTPFAEMPDRPVWDWGVDRVKAPEVWQQGYTGEGIVVAVVDSGVDYTHSDLDQNIWRNSRETANGRDDDGNGYVDDLLGWDFVSNSNNPIDRNGHGTHVAGTIAAENNGYGATGVAFNAKIMPVKVLSDSGYGSNASVAQGIRYAARNGADVINLSLGGDYSAQIERAVRFATRRGAVVVMAAGNEGSYQPSHPASLARRWGIAVGAQDWYYEKAYFSNRAGFTPLDYVVAPGVDTYSTTPGERYEFLSGTSMAAPHVAGVAALMLNANPYLTPAQTEAILTATANPNAVWG